MAPLANERVVRSFILGSAVLSIPMLIAASIVSALGRRSWYGMEHEVISICFSFITMAMSIFLSIGYFRRAKKEESDDGTPVKRRVKVLWSFLDLLNSLCYLGVLIPVWVIEPRRLSVGAMMVVTYATCFLIVNMVAHFYLATSFISTALKRCCYFPKECPNCRHPLAPSSPQMASSPKAHSGYSLIRGEIYLDEDTAPDAAPLDSPASPGEGPSNDAGHKTPEEIGKGVLEV